MQISNCVMCGKIFRHDGMDTKHCEDCSPLHEKMLRAVKDLIVENPGLTVQDVSERSGVSYRQIMEWIKEGRISRQV